MNIPKLPNKPIFGDGYENPFLGQLAQHSFNEFWKGLEAWHADLFKGAVEVWGAADNVMGLMQWSQHKALVPNYHCVGLLINVQPIKEETAEDLLRDFVNAKNKDISEMLAIHAKAKAFLEKKK